MKKKDHILLARYWMREQNKWDVNIPLLCRLAFIYGNVEPDINPLTYLHGIRKYKNAYGHSFEHALPVLETLIAKCSEAKGIRYKYYLLGKCCHYATDIFTWPHNPDFGGTMAEHMKYENELHEYLIAVFTENFKCDVRSSLYYGEKRTEYASLKSTLKDMAGNDDTEQIKESWNNAQKENDEGDAAQEPLISEILKMHERYADEKPGCAHDLYYIVQSTGHLICEMMDVDGNGR